jgi:hypothetical protein
MLYEQGMGLLCSAGQKTPYHQHIKIDSKGKENAKMNCKIAKSEYTSNRRQGEP